MAKNNFTLSSLDKLVDDAIQDADQFEEELKDIDENQLVYADEQDTEEPSDIYLKNEDKTFAETKNVVNKESGDSVSFNYVYKKIGDLIDNGNASLQILQSVDPDVLDPSVMSAMASLMNSIRGCISEFTKIHQQWIRFNNSMKLENMRFENRKKLLEYRRKLNSGTLDKSMNENELIESSTADIVGYLQWKKEQEEQKKAKENKI